MKAKKLVSTLILATFVVCAFEDSGLGAAQETTVEELRTVGEAVVRLLETGDAKRFADEIVPSLKDWQSVRSTNMISKIADPLGPDFRKSLDYSRQRAEAAAQNVLVKAAAFGLEPSQMKFRVKEIPSGNLSSFRNQNIQAEGESLPWVPEIEVILQGEPSQQNTNATRLHGEFKLALGGESGGLKFPGGWRFSDGIRWKAFPPGIVSQKAESELAMMNKIFSRHEVTLSDDAALKTLADVFVRFLREHDEQVFVSGALQKMDDIWGQIQRKAAEIGEKVPPKKEFEQVFGTYQDQITQSARGVLDQADRLGLNFTNADLQLKEVVAESVYPRGAYGTLEEVSCNQLRFVFDLHSDLTTKSGRPISGEYILTAARGRRGPERWTIEDKIRWQQFPKDLIGEKEKAVFEFENYVAEHGALPPGTQSPEVEFVRLDDQSKVKSADFRGKILVLEFWSTTCGPCQEPLAKLQSLRAKHPDWKDRVEIVTVSIDDKLNAAREHLEKRGWTNTVSLWAGEGRWYAPPAKAYRLHGIPTAYVIDAGGKVVWAGHPFGDQIPEIVNRLLK
jgi:thiol-disulfide isomerase/thioredoxin